MRARFVFAEVWNGFRRNLTMTVAVIITVAVSLTLFGVSLMVRSQVDTMKDFWYDKVEISMFLCNDYSESPGCSGKRTSPEQVDEIAAELESLKPLVEEFHFEDKEEAFKHFQDQFRNSPMLENVTADSLNESFRVKLSDPTQFDVVASAFEGREGIEQVVDQQQILDRLFQLLGGLEMVALFIAAVMLVVMILLVVNTMRVAAFSRRRETSIMRLVGASSFYIQLPFLLEAAIAAFLGAALACLGMVGLKIFLIDGFLVPNFQFTAFVGWADIVWILPVITLVGVVLASLAAFFTLRKFLRV